ncbi:hypothetical protein H4Q26_014105 [Puccinia striiformis f. sp. tritici PST-130]|nr:hypothetical protein H4Q26_014105 [Puccinia striiformis f. sp. tritici PST-130]
MWKQKAKSVCGGSTTGRSYFSTKRFSRLAKIVKGLRGRIKRSEAADCEEKFSRIQEGLRKSVFEGTLELINFTKKTGKLNEMEMEWFVGEKKKIIDVIKEIAIRMLAVFEEHASADLNDWLNRGLAIELGVVCSLLPACNPIDQKGTEDGSKDGSESNMEVNKNFEFEKLFETFNRTNEVCGLSLVQLNQMDQALSAYGFSGAIHMGVTHALTDQSHMTSRLACSSGMVCSEKRAS